MTLLRCTLDKAALRRSLEKSVGNDKEFGKQLDGFARRNDRNNRDKSKSANEKGKAAGRKGCGRDGRPSKGRGKDTRGPRSAPLERPITVRAFKSGK